MRVVLSTYDVNRGGPSRTLEAWARLLPLHGIEPVVTVGGRGALDRALREAGLPTAVRPLRVVPRLSWPVPFVFASSRLAATAVRAGAAVLHVNEHPSQPVAAMAARLARLPLVTHMRFRPTPEFSRWLFKPGRTPQRLLFTSETQMADSAAAIEPVISRDRWRVLPNGLDFSVFGADRSHRDRVRSLWGLRDEAIAVGIACTLSARKRVDHFIRLIARLRTEGIDAHGFIAGRSFLPVDRGVRAQLEQLVASLDLKDVVRFLGHVEPSEPLFHAWDISISTSEYETFGMSVLESMGCGCPVVAYPGGSVAEIVGSSAVIVPDGDEHALFEACLHLSQQPSARLGLGARGRAHARATYDIRHIVPRLADLYRELC